MVKDREILELAKEVLDEQPVFRSKDIARRHHEEPTRQTIRDRLRKMHDEYEVLCYIKCGSAKAWYLDLNQ